jgi:polyisoprenoid-binding protein YceI
MVLGAACWTGLAVADEPAPPAAPASAPAAAAVYRFDPDLTFATFEVRHFGTSTLRGRFGPLSGSVTIDPAARQGDLRLRIPVGTLSTGARLLDARLKAADMLDVANYPEAYFIATAFRFGADGGVQEVRGEFIVHGTSQPLSLFADRFACRQDPARGGRVCGGDFHGDLKRGEFGLNYGEPFVGDDVHLVVQVEASAP